MIDTDVSGVFRLKSLSLYTFRYMCVISAQLLLMDEQLVAGGARTRDLLFTVQALHTTRPGWFFFSPFFSLWSAFAVCIHSIRDFWGEKQSIVHLYKPQFNKWDSCFMQLIWWQPGGIRSNKLLRWRGEEPQPQRGCSASCNQRRKFDMDKL